MRSVARTEGVAAQYLTAFCTKPRTYPHPSCPRQVIEAEIVGRGWGSALLSASGGCGTAASVKTGAPSLSHSVSFPAVAAATALIDGRSRRQKDGRNNGISMSAAIAHAFIQ